MKLRYFFRLICEAKFILSFVLMLITAPAGFSYTTSQGLNIIDKNMDMVKAQRKIVKFLNTLRKQGKLLSEKEFEKKYKDSEGRFIQKTGIQRLVGAQYTQEAIKKSGSKHIKIPKKIAVFKIKPNNGMARFKLDKLELKSLIFIVSEDFVTHAQSIKKSQQQNINCEELKEFFNVIELTGFYDLRGNFVVANDGIYIIDTEYGSFMSNIFAFDGDLKDAIALMKEQLNGLVRDWLNTKDANDPMCSKKFFKNRVKKISDKWASFLRKQLKAERDYKTYPLFRSTLNPVFEINVHSLFSKGAI